MKGGKDVLEMLQSTVSNKIVKKYDRGIPFQKMLIQAYAGHVLGHNFSQTAKPTQSYGTLT